MRRLLAVHAHPDDETFFTGGTLARAAGAGDHVCVVTATDGQLGLASGRTPEQLGEVRRAELLAACAALGVTDVRPLGYRDSASGEDPRSFVRVPVDDIAARIREVLQDVRPDVVITYDAYGFYGHPDHIHVHNATVRAVRSSDAELFYAARTADQMRAMRSIYRRISELQGVVHTDGILEETHLLRMATDPTEIVWTVDVSSQVPRILEAFAAHDSQLHHMVAALRECGEPQLQELFGAEHYVRG